MADVLVPQNMDLEGTGREFGVIIGETYIQYLAFIWKIVAEPNLKLSNIQKERHLFMILMHSVQKHMN